VNALVATIALSATLAPCPTLADAGAVGGPSLTWVQRAGKTVVEVSGLDDDLLRHLKQYAADDERWPAVLVVRLSRPAGQPDAAPLVGRFEIEEHVLRFIPRYPPLAGMRYVAKFGSNRLEAVYSPPAKADSPLARVVAVYPTADVVPENLLKLYLHFSAPMSRGEAYRRVRVRDASGKPLERPFLEIGEELWDPGGMRLTLLFDPGRIKRGLVPREEEGPILEQGKSYRLEVDATWPDADGRPLAQAFSKPFRAGPPDIAQPDPKLWTFETPSAGTREPLVVHFPDPLDHAMLGRAIDVQIGGAIVEGIDTIGPVEKAWRFVPSRLWPRGPIEIRVDSELEDLAGNSIARPFEVDVVRDGPRGPGVPRVTVPVPRRSP
jgi:hypothetical protein